MSIRRIIWFPAMLLLLLMEGNLSAQSFIVSISTVDDTEICAGDSVLITLEITIISKTDPPFRVVINDKDGEYSVLDKITFPYSFFIFPESDNSYYVAEAYDRRGRTGAGTGTVDVVVYPYTPVSIILERTAYLVTEPGVPLQSDPPGGIFSGEGVINNIFYPGLLTPEGSPYQINCSYIPPYGCASSNSVDVFLLSGNASVYIVTGTDTVNNICGDVPTCIIKGTNDDNLAGTFSLYDDVSPDPITGHIIDNDLNDNEAELLLDGLSGIYTVVYSYGMQNLEINASGELLVHDVGPIGIQSLPDTVCSTDGPFPLVPDVSHEDPDPLYIFSGPGVSGNQSEGYFFDPSLSGVAEGEVTIGLEYRSSNGCLSVITFPVYVGLVPELSFSPDQICIGPGGSTVLFVNHSSQAEQVETWNWDFGDPESGSSNTSNLENPEHYYSDPGPRTIVLNASTYAGCEALSILDTQLVDRPLVDFDIQSDCFTSGEAVFFEGSTSSVFALPDTLIWTFRTSEGELLGVTGKDASDPLVEFLFPSPGSYSVSLFSRNAAGCYGELTGPVQLYPVQVVTNDGYLETFDQLSTEWFAESDDSLQSWVLGEPDFTGFEPVANDLAWYTHLPVFEEDYIEHSWVRSPCFDLSGVDYPVIQMDLLKSLTPGLDGAVLQYQSAPADGWINVGTYGQGSNWYNHSMIYHMPGGSSEGWSLLDPQPDEQWVTASHPLLIADRNIPVKFRLAIATEGTREMVPGVFNQGFAFDNFSISNVILRRSVLEYFTNAAGDLVYAADSAVKQYATEYAGMVFDLQYHMDYPAEDPMNLYNPYPALTRAFNYGVPGVPYAVLNGGATPDYRYDLSLPSGHLDEETLLLSASESPSFDVSLSVNYLEDRLEGQVSVTCLAGSFESNLQLYIVVLEEEVTSYPSLTRDTAFRNVVLDMIPYEGIMLGNNWSSGSVATRNFDWDYPEYVEDIEDLSVVVFVQDRDDNWIYQAEKVSFTNATAVTENMDPYAPFGLYPNPAGDDLTVYFGIRTGSHDRLVLIDMSGREVMNVPVPDGSLIQQMDLSRLESGMYTIFWEERRIIRGYAKLIHFR